MQIDSIPDGDDPKLRNGWIILSPKKSFSVYATTSKEKTEWMLHINNCIEKLTNRAKRLATSTNVAPQWIPDRNADTCMRCRKAKFTVVNRRHHCRKCGFVICGDCSKNKYLLKSQADEPVRVCDVCYTALQSTGGDYRYESAFDWLNYRIICFCLFQMMIILIRQVKVEPKISSKIPKQAVK
jgi:hypothetical protein